MIALSEMSPFAFHLCNVVLHSIMTILFFALLQKMGACTSTAFFASLIASAHPIMVNIVASVAGRATLLAGIFSLASVCLYLSAEKNIGAFIAAVLCAIAAFFSSESWLFTLLMLIHIDLFFLDISSREETRY